MNRNEKSALSKKRILEAALAEFSQKGYDGASLNTVWQEKAAYLQTQSDTLSGDARSRLQQYFDARLRFFADNPVYLGIFVDVSFSPPEKLYAEIADLRRPFDQLNIAVLTKLLKNESLQPGLSAELVVDDFRMYMDYFNMHFKVACTQSRSCEALLRQHEEICHRQLDILLYGVLDRSDPVQSTH